MGPAPNPLPTQSQGEGTGRHVVLAFLHHRIAQHADAWHLNFYHIAILHVLRGTVGAHPQHIARVERHILTHAADVVAYTEDGIADLIGKHLFAIEPDGDLEVIRL